MMPPVPTHNPTLTADLIKKMCILLNVDVTVLLSVYI